MSSSAPSLRSAAPVTVLAALLAAAPPTLADVIRRTDGELIEDVSVVEENLAEVKYKSGRTDRTVPSDEVLSITYTKKPRDVDEAETMLVDGSYVDALDKYSEYVEGILDGSSTERRYKWAPAYAAWKVVEIEMSLGNLPGAVTAANRVLGRFPDSRFVPAAYLTKANALHWQGKSDEAQKALQSFQQLIKDRNLSRRWELECKLALVQTDPRLRGVKKRDELVAIQDDARGDYPTVRNRARVAEGESFLEEAEGVRDTKARLGLVGKARPIFEKILEDFKADDETLAGAYAGMGDCLFQEAVARDKEPGLLKEALHHYLRVTVLYKDQNRYLPKALFSAGLCFEYLGGDEDRSRSRSMYRNVIANFPDSTWAAEAQKRL